MNSNPELTRATSGSAGYDLLATSGCTLQPGQRQLIGTGVHYVIPDGFVAIIKPRSGLAVKYGLDVLAGVCDADYRGEVKVCLINHGQEPCVINSGDKIAQMILTRFHAFDNEKRGDLVRGDGGFGSTG